MNPVALTGIKPSATPHLGNYLGAIRPALRLVDTYDAYYFIADYHALTTLRDADALNRYVYDVVATWVASGLDPARCVLFRQSDIAEVFELMWVLSCTLATGQLERGHAYKDALARDENPNAGIFNYPVLMAADILLYDAQIVPVGRDQKQHLELARDVATRVNHLFGEGTVKVPEVHVTESPLVPGTDGRKMSKSYGNSIPLFESAKALRKVVMKIKTGSESLEAPKDPDCAVVQLFSQVAQESDTELLKGKLRRGGYGWGHAKEALFEVLEAELAPLRARYHELRADEATLDDYLKQGAVQARVRAHATIERVRRAVGVRK